MVPGGNLCGVFIWQMDGLDFDPGDHVRALAAFLTCTDGNPSSFPPGATGGLCDPGSTICRLGCRMALVFNWELQVLWGACNP